MDSLHDIQELGFQNDIILISGKQGSGKSTLAEGLMESDTLTERYGFKHRIRFADFLYERHDEIRESLRQRGIDNVPEKDGDLLQTLGSHFRKKYGADFFVNIVRNQILGIIQTHTTAGNLFIIEDCRFENEYNLCKAAYVVRLHAEESIRKERAESWRENTTHESEIGLDHFPKEKFSRVVETGWGVSPVETLDLVVQDILERYSNGVNIKPEDFSGY